VFRYKSDWIAHAFIGACKFLSIEGLKFHDLRHEATRHLFELGYQVQDVAQFMPDVEPLHLTTPGALRRVIANNATAAQLLTNPV